MPVNAKLTAPVPSDGAGAEIPLCTLPVANGYEATINQFDLTAGKAKTMTLKVAGSEKLTVGGKSFETFRIEIKPDEGEEERSTLWISKDVRNIVKIESKLPAQMGGGIVTYELVQ